MKAYKVFNEDLTMTIETANKFNRFIDRKIAEKDINSANESEVKTSFKHCVMGERMFNAYKILKENGVY